MVVLIDKDDQKLIATAMGCVVAAGTGIGLFLFIVIKLVRLAL